MASRSGWTTRTPRSGSPSRNDLDALDGPAAVSTVDGGYGLTGMRERLRLLNGTLEAGRRDGQWVVTAVLPRPAPENMTP